MGSAAAWWLARRGRDVALLEQFEPGHTRGSSHGGVRIFRFAYEQVDYVRLAQAALPLWRELEDDAGEVLLELTGGVDHGHPDDVDAVAAALAATGSTYEVLAPEAAAERWPGMRFEGATVYSPDGGRCRADATVAALQRRAAAHGADVRFGLGPATVAVVGDGVVVRAGDEEWTAPVAVVTAGGWVERVLPGVSLPPLRVSREQVQHFAPIDDTVWPSFIHHRRPWLYGLLTPGEGMKVASHLTGPLTDPDRVGEIDPERQAAMVRYVEEWFPGLDPTPILPATCIYTTTPAEDFVLDRVGPIVVGSPCSGHGFKFTPVIGRILADLADGKPGPGGRFAL
jgi:sarcosine oxidase